MNEADLTTLAERLTRVASSWPGIPRTKARDELVEFGLPAAEAESVINHAIERGFLAERDGSLWVPS